MRAPETITDYLDAAVTTALDEMDTKFSELESRIRAKEVVSGPVIMDELERVSATLSYAWGVAGHLISVRARERLVMQSVLVCLRVLVHTQDRQS